MVALGHTLQQLARGNKGRVDRHDQREARQRADRICEPRAIQHTGEVGDQVVLMGTEIDICAREDEHRDERRGHADRHG